MSKMHVQSTVVGKKCSRYISNQLQKQFLLFYAHILTVLIEGHVQTITELHIVELTKELN